MFVCTSETVKFNFTSDSTIQQRGFLLEFDVLPPPVCSGVTTVDLRSTATSTATGWLSHDYSWQLAAGAANQTHPPVLHPVLWLSGYSGTSSCQQILLVPPRSVVSITMQYASFGSSNDVVSQRVCVCVWFQGCHPEYTRIGACGAQHIKMSVQILLLTSLGLSLLCRSLCRPDLSCLCCRPIHTFSKAALERLCGV